MPTQWSSVWSLNTGMIKQSIVKQWQDAQWSFNNIYRDWLEYNTF